MLKQILKYSVAVPVYYTGLLSLLNRSRMASSPHSGFLILMYHRVLDKHNPQFEYTQEGLRVTPHTFEQQVKTLKSDYELISLSTLCGWLISDQPVPARTAVITFDDGWADNYEFAFPILRKHGVPATIFVSTDFIESERVFWFQRAAVIQKQGALSKPDVVTILERIIQNNAGVNGIEKIDPVRLGDAFQDVDSFLEQLKVLPPEIIDLILDEFAGVVDVDWSADKYTLTWEQIREMQESGIEFGSHACSHRILPQLTRDEIYRELSVSRSIMEQKLGRTVDLLAYPNGSYDDRVISVARDAGYRAALAVQPAEIGGRADLFALPRMPVSQNLSAGLFGKFSRAMFMFNLRR